MLVRCPAPDGQICSLDLPHRLGIKPDVRHQGLAIPAGSGGAAVRAGMVEGGARWCIAGQCRVRQSKLQVGGWSSTQGTPHQQCLAVKVMSAQGRAGQAAAGKQAPVVLAWLRDHQVAHLLRQLLQLLLTAAASGFDGRQGCVAAARAAFTGGALKSTPWNSNSACPSAGSASSCNCAGMLHTHIAAACHSPGWPSSPPETGTDLGNGLILLTILIVCSQQVGPKHACTGHGASSQHWWPTAMRRKTWKMKPNNAVAGPRS
jgi:hypothetical protein